MLTTFQLVNNNKTISPVLTTTREYGNWFEDTFDEYTSQMELYIRSKKKSGELLLEWHPGTRIGNWFDSNTTNSLEYKNWFILQASPMMERLVKLKMAEQRDAIPIAVNKGQKMLRVYTVDQIQLYIRAVLDKNFNISKYLGTPKQIKVKDTDLDKLIMPKLDMQKRRLF